MKMHMTPDEALHSVQLRITQAMRLLDIYIAADVECNSIDAGVESGHRWYDTSGMTDPHEHSPELIDQARVAIAMGLARGILHRHPTQPMLLRTSRVTWP